VQDEVVLARIDGRWHQVRDGFPSTHLVKPVPDAHPTLIFDDEYGTRLSRRARVTTSFAWLQDFDDTPGLVIERYDRTPARERIQQEDFSQVLGAQGDQKYQAISGKVSLRRVAAVFGARGDRSSLGRLLDQVTVAAGIGNLDLHTRNLSLLHPLDATPSLAPAYDVVPLRQHADDGQMALAVDGEYQHAALTVDHLVAEAESWRAQRPPPGPRPARPAPERARGGGAGCSSPSRHPRPHRRLRPESAERCRRRLTRRAWRRRRAPGTRPRAPGTAHRAPRTAELIIVRGCPQIRRTG
jgi:serine/threonine-protein kinase HipA